MPALVPPVLPAGVLAARRQPVLRRGALTLRPWTALDAPTLVTAYADPDIQRWHCRSLDEAEAVALVEVWAADWASETGASWAVTDGDGQDVLGRVGLRQADLPDGRAEVNYWVLPAARGRGVATAAVQTLAHWAFGEIGFQRLELVHSTRNRASCRVADATAFALEGTMLASTLHTDGWHDMHLHARLRTDRQPVTGA